MHIEVKLSARAKWHWLPGLLLAIASLNALSQTLVPFTANDSQPKVASQENLLNLSIEGSALRALPEVPGGTVETADFTRELYQMQWRDGDPIDVYVIVPRGVVKPPVAIYLYGYPVDANRFRNDAFCKLVTRGGVAAIGFVPALTGQRYHDVPMRTWFVSDLHDSIVKTVHDVQMIANYAGSRKDLDGRNIAIFGQGAGATIAGLAATVDPRIQAVDLLDPWGDWPTWVARSQLIPDAERADFAKPEYLAPLAPLDPVHWLPTLAGRAVKLDDALFETGTPAESKARIEAAMPASGVLMHYATRAEFQARALADGQLVMWIQDQLLNESRRQSVQAPSSAASTTARAGNAIDAPDHH